MMRNLVAAFVMGALAGAVATVAAVSRRSGLAPVGRDLVTLPRAELSVLEEAALAARQRPEAFRYEARGGELALECMAGGECNLEVPARGVARAAAPLPVRVGQGPADGRREVFVPSELEGGPAAEPPGDLPELATPLERFELMRGDVIVEVDGRVITSPLEALTRSRDAKEIVVRREGKDVRLKAKL